MKSDVLDYYIHPVSILCSLVKWCGLLCCFWYIWPKKIGIKFSKPHYPCVFAPYSTDWYLLIQNFSLLFLQQFVNTYVYTCPAKTTKKVMNIILNVWFLNILHTYINIQLIHFWISKGTLMIKYCTVFAVLLRRSFLLTSLDWYYSAVVKKVFIAPCNNAVSD